MTIVGSVLSSIGAAICLLAALGIVVFPTPLSRMHAATKAASVGLSAVTVGAGVIARSPGLIAVGILVTGFLFLTAPVSGHLLGRAAYLASPGSDLVRDDLRGVTPRTLQIRRPPTRDFSVVRWITLIVVWVALWQDPSLGTVAAGAVIAGVLEAIRASVQTSTRVRWLRVPGFVAGYAGIVIRSTISVARDVLGVRTKRLREAIVAVPLGSADAVRALLVADAVSFAPGTLTLDLGEDPAVLYVHVLRFESVEATRAEVGEIERRVEEIFAGGPPRPE